MQCNSDTVVVFIVSARDVTLASNPGRVQRCWRRRDITADIFKTNIQHDMKWHAGHAVSETSLKAKIL